ncbi:hypothetical protein K435DRAFT_792446 [Dendrothele bispora CBS 962.96]|uniref:Carboxymuconolactone decarboxylase-like domain-containing protein n=1 Tax=Dendrothele bispora (strain CBS 962.96) TaxID=1314807 RepID=A0A4S8MIU4_DENBC|nr:hypothetical protein K435DRAFT_792446 [Dendrothele bispora CBS 962.96]
MVSVLSVFGLFTLLLSSTLASAVPKPALAKRDNGVSARVPYIFPAPGTDEIADEIRARRTNGTLLDLDGALLNSPLMAQGWNDLFGVIRDNNSLPAQMRESFILRAAALNRATYQWLQHEPVALSVGLTPSQISLIRFTPAHLFQNSPVASRTLGPELTAAMILADFINVDVHVPDFAFEGLKKFLTEQQMVDAFATSGGYAFVSRFTVGLNLDGEMDVVVPSS